MFKGNPTVIEGFEIPYDGWLFLVLLSIHVGAGLVCVISGIFAMLSNKQRGIHSRSGKIYYWGLWVVFSTATIISIDRWQEDYHLFMLGAVSFTTAFVGRLALKRRWKQWSVYHITGMGISYIFLLIAFYVDNGRFLPLWKDLHPAIYWLLPLLIGAPLLVRTLFTHPLSKHHFRKPTQ